MSDLDDVLAALVRHYNFHPSGFTLAGGEKSSEYVDCSPALADPRVLRSAGQLIHAELLPSIACVGGLTMGADPLAIATCYASAGTARPVSWFSVRKKSKRHGMGHMLEGEYKLGDVAIVDDVATSGGSVIEAVRKVRREGLVVGQVIVLLDRQRGGMDNIRVELDSPKSSVVVPVTALFTIDVVRAEFWLQHPPAREP